VVGTFGAKIGDRVDRKTLARYRFQRTAPEGGGGGNGQQQDGTQGGTGGTGQQGGGTDGQQQQGSLLEADADDLNGSNDDGQQQGQQQQTGQIDTNALVQQLEERLGSRFDAIADRRVNALLNAHRQSLGQQQQQGQQQQNGSPGVQNGQQDQSQQQPRPASASDLRAARLAFREYVGDEVKFISAEERAFAMDLGSALLVQQAQHGIDDEDRAGRTVAAEVAKKVKDLRKHYEDRTVAALRRRGVLTDQQTGGGHQQSRQQSGGGQVGEQSAFSKGAEIAARVRPRPPSP
jgi:hypothetical protein